jgi:phosphoenolpyruvate carboxykinase (ATP)
MLAFEIGLNTQVSGIMAAKVSLPMPELNLSHARAVFENLSVAELIEEAVRRGEGQLAENGALAVRTGKYTGRSPGDKFIVRDALTTDQVDWGKTNQPFDSQKFDALWNRVQGYLQGWDAFVFDGFVGADPNYRLPIRVVTEQAWHSLFARQLFLRPTPAELAAHVPQFTVLDAGRFLADPALDGTKSETFIILDLSRRLALIGGTEYAGEIKKSLFSALNFLLPQDDVFPMHCSANVGASGDVALFFGLSGTGKTTLSADPERRLIGDDEHGWSDHGVFNFEGGCYAKCIHLSSQGEPEIWSAIRYGTVLENVVLDSQTRCPDYDDARYTENTRAAYPLEFIPDVVFPSVGGQPKNVIFLTADATGVLPPISRLTRDQAMYHFLSGYTSKLAGTERGVTTPQATFSTCFGAPFMSLPPSRYARMLGERLDRHGAQCWLVNTGWSGGPFGVGKRMDLGLTRLMIHAILSGALSETPTIAEPFFGLPIPQTVPGIPAEVLNPHATWPDPTAYETAARSLAARFVENFHRFESTSADLVAAGPTLSRNFSMPSP